MNPLIEGLEQVEERVGHSLHPAVVAIPMGAWVTSAVSDVLSITTGSRAYDDAARVCTAVGLIGATAAVVTGLHDYSYIPRERKLSHEIATTHAIGNVIVSSLFVTSYILRSRSHRREERPSWFARAFGLLGTGLLAYTGWLGGKLVLEQGEAVKPIIKQQSEAEKLKAA